EAWKKRPPSRHGSISSKPGSSNLSVKFEHARQRFGFPDTAFSLSDMAAPQQMQVAIGITYQCGLRQQKVPTFFAERIRPAGGSHGHFWRLQSPRPTNRARPAVFPFSALRPSPRPAPTPGLAGKKNPPRLVQFHRR